jgi:hypothetical protein
VGPDLKSLKNLSHFSAAKNYRFADHVYHAFHHNLSSIKLRSALTIFKKPLQKPCSPAPTPTSKKTCAESHNRTGGCTSAPADAALYCGDFGTW